MKSYDLIPNGDWDDTICFSCQAELPDDDLLRGTDMWWEGFCSSACAREYSNGAHDKYLNEQAKPICHRPPGEMPWTNMDEDGTRLPPFYAEKHRGDEQ